MAKKNAKDQTGDNLRVRWEERRKVIEISFENDFVSYLPWGEQCVLDDQPQAAVEVNNLCHVTHRNEADLIYDANTRRYTFGSQPKRGKYLYNEIGNPMGHSHRYNSDNGVPNQDTTYQYCNQRNHFLPEGRYSWWGIDNDKVDEDLMSMYGSCKFSFNFPYMLQQFRLAHATDDNQEPSLIFKKYGTLRYKREICYVVLICVDTDDLIRHVRDLPPLTEDGGRVTLNGMLDETGQWNNVDSDFVYNKQNYRQRDNAEGPDREHLVFGFYYGINSPVDSLVLEKDSEQPYDTINHPYCTRTRKIEGNWVCPDQQEEPEE